MAVYRGQPSSAAPARPSRNGGRTKKSLMGLMEAGELRDSLRFVLADGAPPAGDLEAAKSFALAGLGVAVLPRRVARYWQDRRLRRLHPALPFIPDEIHLLFRGDAHRTRAFLITKDAIVAHGRAMDGDYEE